MKEVEDPVRFGHIKVGRGAKPGLLKLVVRPEKAKAAMMKSAAKLNREVTDPAKRVSINHHTTVTEREAFKKLRAELRTRTEAGEQNLAIRGGKIGLMIETCACTRPVHARKWMALFSLRGLIDYLCRFQVKFLLFGYRKCTRSVSSYWQSSVASVSGCLERFLIKKYKKKNPA